MRALILAAGYGNRMRPLTDGTHKSLLRIGGCSVIDRIIGGLVAHGVTRFTIVTGYRADEVVAHVEHGWPQLELQFVHNDRFHETNNIYSMALAFQQMDIEDDVVLIESDLIADPAVFERIIHSPHANVALVDRWRVGLDGTVVTVADGVVTSVVPPHLQGADFSFHDKFKTLNIYKFSRDFCRDAFRQLLSFYAQAIDCNAFYELVLGILIYVKQVTIHAEIIEGTRWAEIDDANDLRGAEFVFDSAARRRILEHDMGGYWSYDVVDFCFIRNMYFPTPAIMAELRENLAGLLQNYGSRQEILDRKLATLLLCSPQRVVALNGASQIFPFLARRFAGRDVLRPHPTFGEFARSFPQARTYGDGDPLQACHLLVVVNPNNPTGATRSTQSIHEFAAQNDACTVLVDESFIAFSDQPSMVSLLERQPLPNVLVLTSLSKSLGVPGMRLGFVYTCDAALRDEVLAGVPIWNLNAVAENFLEIVLKHRVALDASLQATRRDREEFGGRLERLACVVNVHPSGGNFLHVTMRPSASGEPAAERVDGTGQDLVDRLLQRHNIFVKDISTRFDDGGIHLRLAVRLPHENRALCEALEAEAGT